MALAVDFVRAARYCLRLAEVRVVDPKKSGWSAPALVVMVSALFFAAAAWYLLSLGGVGVAEGRGQSRHLLTTLRGRTAGYFSLLPLSISVLLYLQSCQMASTSTVVRVVGALLIGVPALVFIAGLPA